MSTSTKPLPDRALRTRFAFAAAILLIAVTASALLLGILGSRTATRIDLTAARAHQLAPQTAAILKKLERPVKLVLAADFGSVDRSIRQRTRDVLAKFHTASPNFTPIIIDTGSAEGLASFDKLLKDLADEARPALQKQQVAVEAAIQTADDASKELDAIAASLLAVRDAMQSATVSPETIDTLRKYFESETAKVRSFSEDLKKAAALTRTRLAEPGTSLPVPPLDAIARVLRAPMSELSSGLNILNTALDQFARAEDMPRPAAALATEASQATARLRDRLARQVAAIDALQPLPILTVARTIQRTRAAILIADPREGDADSGGKNLAAIDMGALLPPPITIGGDANAPVIDTRFRTEELIAAALATLSGQARPLALFVHGAPRRLMPTMGPLGQTAARLNLRGFDFTEWPVALDNQPPAQIAGAADRPVVYIMVWMTIDRPEDAGTLGKLASAARQLTTEGKNLLISVGPSSLPGAGAADPLADFLPELGLQVDTGLLLLEEGREAAPGGGGGGSGSGSRRVVFHNQQIIDPGSSHPLAQAVSGLATLIEWPIPMRPAGSAPPANVTLFPILTVPASSSHWAEPEWLGYWQTGRDERARLPRLPAPDSPRDQIKPATGDAWWLAAAIERTSPAFTARQRIVVVGSPTWYFDQIADKQTVVDGRATPAWPGNFEFLHASLAWLSGREDLMVRGAQATALPVIPSLSSQQQTALRLALIAGLPLLVLVLGATWRVLRG